MSRQMVTAAGIVMGIVALAAVACSQQADVSAPASTDGPGSNVTGPGATTGPLVSSQPTVSILDTVDPEECDFVYNINACFTDGQPPANIPLSEYAGLFMMARDDLKDRFGTIPESVKMTNLEKLDWGDASLGNPEPGIMYAQMITPGFKMLLAAGGSTYTYHTSMDRVVFVEMPSGVDIRGLLIAIEIIDAQDTVGLDFGRTIGSILVESAIEDDTRFDKARVRVTDKTRIFLQEQGERHAVTFASLGIGKALAEIEVQFTIGPVAESYPVQVTAAEIVILSQSSGSVPPGADADVTEGDEAEIVRSSLEWALVTGTIPDYGLYFSYASGIEWSEMENVTLSVENIDAGMLPQMPGVELTLRQPDEIQKRADEEGDFIYLRFSQLEVSSSEAKVSLDSTWAVGKDSEETHHAGYAFCNAEYHKESGTWEISEPFVCAVP